MACNRCKGTSSDPFNFLLSCSECGKNWHHRCHIPPLVDEELIALIRATNDNDVDNGLSSWVGRCCRRVRVRVQTQAMPAPIGLAQPRSSVSADPDLPADVIYRGSQKAAEGPKHQASLYGAAPLPKPDDGRVDGDVSFHKPRASVELQTTSTMHAGVPGNTALLLPDTELPHPTPLPDSSAGFAPPLSSNRSTPFFPHAHLHENSMTLAQESSGQPADVHAVSPLFKHTTPLGGASYASTKSISMEINPPTLDLRALSLNRAPGASKAPSRLLFHRTTTFRPPSPPPIPPVKSEDDEMEDLYGQPLGLPSPHASRHEPRRQRSLSLQLPAESEPRVLPVLAAKDPHILAVLEGQELREAARPRRGMRKAQAIRGAGKKRAGFVFVEGLTDKSRWAISRK